MVATRSPEPSKKLEIVHVKDDAPEIMEAANNDVEPQVSQLEPFSLDGDYHAYAIDPDTSSTQIFTPPLNKNRSDFVTEKKLPKVTFHEISKVFCINDDMLTTLFYKENVVYKEANKFMPELEATFAAYQKYLSPKGVADTYAILNEQGEYTGVASEEISDFKSLVDDPLTEKDIEFEKDFFNPTVIWLCHHLDNQLYDLENQIRQLEKKLAYIEKVKSGLKERLKFLRQNGFIINAKEVDQITEKLEALNLKETQVNKEISLKTKQILNSYDQIKNKHGIDKETIQQFRLVKGLSIGTTASYINKEDDLHRNNMSKKGERIDYDMSYWDVTTEFKNCAPLVEALASRVPDKDTFQVTSYDITNHPNLKHAHPHFWPTKEATIKARASQALSSYIPTLSVSSNNYNHETIDIFRRLAPHPVWVHYKFYTLLKFILTDAEVYQNMALLHLRKHAYHNGKYIVQILTDSVRQRIKDFRTELLRTPSFIEFLTTNGDKALTHIIKEHEKRNDYYLELAKKTDVKLIEAQQHHDALIQTLNALQKNNVELENEVQLLWKKSCEKINPERENDDKKFKQKFEELDVQKENLKTQKIAAKALSKKIHQLKIESASYENQMVDTELTKSEYFNLQQQSHDRSIEPVTPDLNTTRFSPHISPSVANNTSKPGFFNKSHANSFSTPTCDYKIIQKILIEKMNAYINPGLFSGFGFARTQSATANALILVAENLNPKSNNYDLNVKAMLSLKARLDAEIKKLEKGEFRTVLNDVLNNEAWNVMKADMTLPLLNAEI